MNYFAIPALPAYQKPKITPITDPLLVFTLIANHQGFTAEKILERSRKRDIVFARQLIAYYLRKQCGLTWSRIGIMLGDRDHTTAIHCVQAINDLIFSDDDVRRIVNYYDQNLME